MIAPERIRPLNDLPRQTGRYVLYWMQAAVRSRFNHALEHALARAAEENLPLLACFGLTDRYPEANARHYAFLLEGLADAARGLAERGVRLVVRRGSPDDVVLDLAREAARVVTDMGYLRIQRAWRARVAAGAPCAVEQVETEAVVPVEAAAPHEAVGAYVLRPRIMRQLARFLAPPEAVPARRDAFGLDLPPGLDVADPAAVLATLDVDRSVAPVAEARGGETAAAEVFAEFLDARLAGYAQRRGDPVAAGASGISPYLHYGHVSPVELVLAVRARARGGADADALVEQLVVRRELSFNFCHYNERYDSFAALPDWARATLAAHARDPRPALYSEAQLEAAQTADPYWNAAQNQMLRTGAMHNALRMYWGKKILEWTARPEDAFATALRLNNKYELDGRDPNSFAGVAWCFGKHDRPFVERPVFGRVRYMNDKGLERKFEIAEYARRWA